MIINPRKQQQPSNIPQQKSQIDYTKLSSNLGEFKQDIMQFNIKGFIQKCSQSITIDDGTDKVISVNYNTLRKGGIFSCQLEPESLMSDELTRCTFYAKYNQSTGDYTLYLSKGFGKVHQQCLAVDGKSLVLSYEAFSNLPNNKWNIILSSDGDGYYIQESSTLLYLDQSLVLSKQAHEWNIQVFKLDVSLSNQIGEYLSMQNDSMSAIFVKQNNPAQFWQNLAIQVIWKEGVIISCTFKNTVFVLQRTISNGQIKTLFTDIKNVTKIDDCLWCIIDEQDTNQKAFITCTVDGKCLFLTSRTTQKPGVSELVLLSPEQMNANIDYRLSIVQNTDTTRGRGFFSKLKNIAKSAVQHTASIAKKSISVSKNLLQKSEKFVNMGVEMGVVPKSVLMGVQSANKMTSRLDSVVNG